MPIVKRNNKIMKRGGKILNRYIKTLTFQVEGDRFPIGIGSNNDRGEFYFVSEIPQNVTINWGDGVVENHVFHQNGGNYRFGFRAGSDFGSAEFNDAHIFQDGQTGLRNITFEFSNFESLIEINSLYSSLWGNFPVEVVYANNLKVISLNRTFNLNPIPNEVLNIRTLKTFSTSSTFPVNPTFISDGLFNSQLEELGVSDYVLTDNLTSNFFKINQLKDTLLKFTAQRSKIEILPSELFECILIKDLRINNNIFKSIDARLNQLVNLEILYYSCELFQTEYDDFTLPNWNNLNQLRSISLSLGSNITESYNYSDIVTNWVGLKSFQLFQSFNGFCRNDTELNTFIPYFYQLVIENAFVDPTSPEAIASGYPYQFRSITWGHSSLNVDSTIEPPPNFTPGVFNGGAQTNGQRVYELGAQYAHLIN